METTQVAELQQFLEEVTKIKHKALQEFTEEELRGQPEVTARANTPSSLLLSTAGRNEVLLTGDTIIDPPTF